jgi:hypothetical protein
MLMLDPEFESYKQMIKNLTTASSSEEELPEVDK